MLQSSTVLVGQRELDGDEKGKVLLELYSGLFRCLSCAKRAFESGDGAEGVELSFYAQRIVRDLRDSLDASFSRSVYFELHGLYQFCLERLVRAEQRKDPQDIEDVVQVLLPLKEAWEQLVGETQLLAG